MRAQRESVYMYEGESGGLRAKTKHNRMCVPPLRNPCSVCAFQSTIFSPAEHTVAKGHHHRASAQHVALVSSSLANIQYSCG